MQTWFKIIIIKKKQTLGSNNPFVILGKLFDTFKISPIVLYGCEIWGANCSYKDTDSFEHLHIKFIKEILGFHCKATNVACLAEL
jgi:hypothetical protein